MTADPQAVAAARRRLQRLAWWLDERFRIPGTRIRFGLEAVIGLIPFGGDLIGLLLSGFAVQQAVRLGAPRGLVVKMLGNVGLDFLLGLVPGVGDLADIAFKANTRNLRLLEAFLDAQLPPPPASARRRVGGLLLWLLLVAMGTLVVVWGVTALLASLLH